MLNIIVTLKCGLDVTQGHWKWYHLKAFLFAFHSNYVLSCIVCKILRLIGRKSQNFYARTVFSAPAGDDNVGISWRCLMLIKLEWLGYRMLKKLWWYVKPFSYNTGTSRTDGWTEKRTDRFAISISCISMLTRDKNWLPLKGKSICK